MMRNILIFISGCMFSVGLFVSGMTNPQKVISFLDVFGNWDPSLAFVMLGAIVPTFCLYRLAWRAPKPFFANDFDIPASKLVDRALVIGAILFGVGWGLAGVCPGPGVANLFAGRVDFLIFVVCMFVGFGIGGKIKI